LPETSRGTELRALELRDNDVWIAGNPGAEMLHSADRGQTWQAVPTGTTLPISAIQFADARHGWAVGALGQILATTDGGRTWKPQRGERRAALLAVFSDADDVPLEALARFSAGEGYRSVVSLVTRRDLEAGATPPLVVRLREREALLLAGASDVSMGWQQPLMLALDQSAAGKKVDWRQATMDQDRFMPRLEWRLMSDIRCWRPDVIVTQSVEDRDNKPEAQLIHKALLKAVQQAANDNYKTSLPPWQVKRVVAMLGAQRRGTLSLASSQILPQLGHSLSEHVAPARGLLARFAVPTTESTAYNVAWDEGGRDAPLRDFFSGLNVRPGSDARRAPVMEQATSLDEMRRMAQRRQALQAIVAHKSPEQTNRAAWLAQIGTLTRDLDNASAALLLYQLGCRYQASGQWDLAAETFSQVAEKYPGQSGVTAVSALWLLQYYASGELTVRADREGRVQLAKAEQPETAPRGTAALIPVTEDDRAASRKPPSTPPRDEQPPAVGSGAARRQSAITWAQRLETISTQLAAEPCAVLPAARALAAVDDGKSQRLLMGLRRARGLDAGASGAAAESWLGGRTRGANAPKAVWLCRRTAEKPRLDGRLDDACWHGQEEAVELPGVELRSPRRDDEAWPALVQVAYDQEFLYLAATCRKAPCVEYAAAAGPRQRDAELAAHDRIALMLDIDRDWTSYWRLAVDCRGQTAEDCWGDRTWNPNWYVAAGQQANSWTFEAAIPWSELTSRPPQPRETWAVGVERAVPGVGFQSWTTPASAEAVRPEGFGLLIFQ
jgi:hypothetical protein